MSEIEKYYAAMAAALIDVELQWRLERLPEPSQHGPLDKAIIAEAGRRGIFRTDPPAEHELRADSAQRTA